jgi:hypothetical protein
MLRSFMSYRAVITAAKNRFSWRQRNKNNTRAPQEVAVWIRNYDCGVNVKPFSFNLSISRRTEGNSDD